MELESYPDEPDGESELRRRGIVGAKTLRIIGVEPPTTPLVGDWHSMKVSLVHCERDCADL